MNAKKCDKCGVFYTHNHKVVVDGMYMTGFTVISKSTNLRTVDLCDDCAQHLVDWLKEEDDLK